jgi:ribose 5-phosphate isomerase A
VTSSDGYKQQAAAAALALVKPGMKLGLGTGSTAAHFVDLLGSQVKKGMDIVGVPTSEATRRQALALGIVVSTLDDTPDLDMTIDGADEIDGNLNLIKGGGGAHLCEKIVASASNRLVIIADHAKKVKTLGAFPLPLEIVRFGREATRRRILEAIAAAECTGSLALRKTREGDDFVTDSGNLILDASLGQIKDAQLLAACLADVPGLVEHGLFLDLATDAFIAGPDGVEHLAVKI